MICKFDLQSGRVILSEFSLIFDKCTQVKFLLEKIVQVEKQYDKRETARLGAEHQHLFQDIALS